MQSARPVQKCPGYYFALISFLDYKFFLILWEYEHIMDYKKKKPFTTKSLKSSKSDRWNKERQHNIESNKRGRLALINHRRIAVLDMFHI